MSSLTPDITESLPGELPGGYSIAVTDTSKWDVVIGSLGFNLKPSDRDPYQRGTEQSRKQQLDISDSPGEQSLSSWWTRSQDSWHMGAGVRWFDPGSDAETTYRFASAQGVDVWTQGELTLLHAMTATTTEAAADVYICGLSVAATSGYAKATGNAIAWIPETGSGTSGTLPNTGATQPAAAGGVVWVGHTNGISSFTASTGTVATPYTCTGNARVWWVKARLIAAVGNKLYELSPTASGVVETLHPTPLYTHPQSDWTWSDVTETAGAILASGYSNNSSAVFRFTLELDTSNQPVLSGGSQVAPMPPGEQITCMGAYLGAYIVLGTSAGVRVGFINDDGAIQYGPLSLELSSPARDVTFRDRFAYITVTDGLPDGTSGAVRVDLSAEVVKNSGEGTGRFAWAWDVSAGATGTCLSVCLVGTRVVLATGRIIHEESATVFVDEGWLDTGRIRFATVEPKAFRLARLVSELNGGRVGLTVTTPDGVEARVVEFDPSYSTTSEVPIRLPGGALLHQHLSFRVTLTPAVAGTSPSVSGITVKAVPAASKVRLYQYPLAVFDKETDRNGVTRGDTGSAYSRLAALEALEASGAPVPVYDARTREAYTGQIDTVDFRSTAPPDRHSSGFGGVAVVVIRRL